MGVPRIAVRVGSGEAAEASLIIDAAELSDPHGNPSFWDLARQRGPEPGTEPETRPAIPDAKQSRSFVVGYHVPDERPDLGASTTAIEMRNAFLDRQVF